MKYGAVEELRRPIPKNSPTVQIVESYAIQSFFDIAGELLTPQGQAVLEQPQNEPIIPSTRKESQVGGYAVGLAPWSETPICISFDLGKDGRSAPIVLKPGHTFIPAGEKGFDGFDYGLPFGWLGGGRASLFVFKTKDSMIAWNGTQSEVIYHRYRTEILAGTGVGVPLVAPSYVNKPQRFPWIKEFRFVSGTTSEIQRGEGVLSMSEVTKMMLRLNFNGDISGDTAGIPNNALSFVLWGSDAFGIGADGLTAVNTDNLFHDIYFPDNLVVPVGSRNPILWLPREVASLASNQWGFAVYAVPGSPLIGETIDLVSWGKI